MSLLKSLKLPLRAIAFACAAMLLSLAGASAQSGPIKVGVGLALTGAVPPPARCPDGAGDLARRRQCQGRATRPAGRLVYYDDQSNPTNVPGIYTKLITVDKVDLLLGPYATNMVAPAMPIIMQNNKLTISFMAHRHQPALQLSDKYFSMIPVGPEGGTHSRTASSSWPRRRTPKPQTVAIVAADAEFAQTAADGARDNAKKHGFKIVYDRAIRRRPPISCRSCARCRPLTPISSSSPPIRPTRSASSARRTRSTSRPRCSAAP